jgi:glycerophosphoryl diester phosphodiesterase
VVRGRLGVLVEIKAESIDATGTIERETVRAIRNARMEKEASIISFVPEALGRSLELAPEIERGHLFAEGDVAGVLRGAATARCSLVMPEKGMLGTPLCDAARAEGLRVVSWVVDDPEEFRRLAPLDLYGVCSNAPSLLVEAVWESE